MMSPPTTKLRYALIGAAAVIARTHLAALAQLPRAEVVGMADLNAELGTTRAAEHGCPFFTDHRAMLAATRPDVAVICTPHPFHAGIAIECFAAGAHVLVEKPIAVEVAEADAMIESAEAAGRVLAVSFQQRFRPQVEWMRAFIDAGELGGLVRVLCVEPNYRNRYYYRSAGWRGTWNGEGGGVLLNQGPHPLDLLCHLVGLPQTVWGRTRTRVHQIATEDSADALLEWDGGASGYAHLSTVECGAQGRLELVGDRAALTLTAESLTLQRFTPSMSVHRESNTELYGAPSVHHEEVTFTQPAGGHLAVYRDLEAAITDGRPPRTDGREGRMALELANAIALSSHLGHAVGLPLDRAAYSALLAEYRTVEHQDTPEPVWS